MFCLLNSCSILPWFMSLPCVQGKFHAIQELLGKLHATVSNGGKSEEYESLYKQLNDERQKTRCTMKKMFNKSFGATFLTDTGQESAFAYNIHHYADVYTSKPENFLLYPSEAWLHVPFDIKIMPHHVKVSLVVSTKSSLLFLFPDSWLCGLCSCFIIDCIWNWMVEGLGNHFSEVSIT